MDDQAPATRVEDDATSIQGDTMRRTLALGLVVGSLVIAAPAVADPDNTNTLTRTLACDNGRTVDAVFAGENGSNFNVTVDESVFIYSQLIVDRLPLGPGGGHGSVWLNHAEYTKRHLAALREALVHSS